MVNTPYRKLQHLLSRVPDVRRRPGNGPWRDPPAGDDAEHDDAADASPEYKTQQAFQQKMDSDPKFKAQVEAQYKAQTLSLPPMPPPRRKEEGLEQQDAHCLRDQLPESPSTSTPADTKPADPKTATAAKKSNLDPPNTQTILTESLAEPREKLFRSARYLLRSPVVPYSVRLSTPPAPTPPCRPRPTSKPWGDAPKNSLAGRAQYGYDSYETMRSSSGSRFEGRPSRLAARKGITQTLVCKSEEDSGCGRCSRGDGFPDGHRSGPGLSGRHGAWSIPRTGAST